MKNLFKLKNENKAIKDTIISDIRIFFLNQKIKIIINQKEPVLFLVTTIWNMKAIMIEIKVYQLNNILIKIKRYLKDIINNLKKSDICKIQ